MVWEVELLGFDRTAHHTNLSAEELLARGMQLKEQGNRVFRQVRRFGAPCGLGLPPAPHAPAATRGHDSTGSEPALEWSVRAAHTVFLALDCALTVRGTSSCCVNPTRAIGLGWTTPAGVFGRDSGAV